MRRRWQNDGGGSGRRERSGDRDGGIETKKTSSCRVIRTGTLLGFSKTLISLFVYFFQNSNTMANATT